MCKIIGTAIHRQLLIELSQKVPVAQVFKLIQSASKPDKPGLLFKKLCMHEHVIALPLILHTQARRLTARGKTNDLC